jgi:hypothetical protein
VVVNLLPLSSSTTLGCWCFGMFSQLLTWNFSHDLCDACNKEHVFKKWFDECDHYMSFKESWALVSRWFNIWTEFCSELVSTFANMVIVESSFSILGWEKVEYWLSLMDLFFDGIMQAKKGYIVAIMIGCCRTK